MSSTKKVTRETVKKVVKPAGMSQKNIRILLIVLLLTGLVIRLYRLGYLTLWVDEYMHAMAAVKGKFSHGENNGVLLTWINTSFSAIFGTSEFALRFPVALIGSLLIPVVFYLGKDVFNYRVGLVAAVFTVFSVYLIFWSRVDRPYGIVPVFNTLLALYFWKTMENKSENRGLLGRVGFNQKYLLWALLAFILAMLSQLICFLFVFSAGFYGTFVTIDNWFSKKSTPKKVDAYAILFYLNIVLIILMFTPIGSSISRPVLELFLPKNIAQFILPDVQVIMKTLEGDTWDKCYKTYSGVLKTDFKYMYGLGYLGMILSFFKHRKGFYFLISTFLVPYLLLSFVFTSTSHAKYLIQIYPIFLLSGAYAIYFIAFELLAYVDKKSFSPENKTYLIACNLVLVLMVYGMTGKEDLKRMLTSTKHGNMVNSALSEISYVDWKQPCKYLSDNKKPNDIVMATVMVAPKYYLGLDSVIWFRQLHLNPKWNANNKEEKYVLNEPDNRKNSATTFEQLVNTYNNNPRGWLLADYYFDNALTDPRAKQFVEQNFTYHYNASSDGGVKVFSWDKSAPKPFRSSYVIELGKNENQMASMPFNLQFSMVSPAPKSTVIITAQGIDNDNEAVIVINNNQYMIKQNGDPTKVQTCTIEVPSNIFKVGENSFQFGYNESEFENEDTRGCAIYNIDVR